jgi:hypothetical protein
VTDETPDTSPLPVKCPDCEAPAGTGCYHSQSVEWPEGTVHQARTHIAALRHSERGTCALCAQPMVRTADGDAWHPVAALTVPCPQMADPQREWATYAGQINSGLEPGRPGAQHFRPVVEVDGAPVTLHPGATTVCPECTNGKHPNCDGTSYDLDRDEPTLCACAHASHPAAAPTEETV